LAVGQARHAGDALNGRSPAIWLSQAIKVAGLRIISANNPP
jgi:hypothetical protein